MRTEQKLGTSLKAVVAGIALISGIFVSAVPAGATDAPHVATIGQSIVGSGSDTTFDMMMSIDKIYNAANGCATIWAGTQPFNGGCDILDTASGNGPDFSAYPWVNPGHSVPKELFAVGSGNGIKELCYQNDTKSGTNGINRPVDFARSSSGQKSGATSESCSDLKYVGYAEDAVSWYHFTKNPDGTSTASSRIWSINENTLKAIFQGTVTYWDGLNGNTGVTDINGNPFAVASSSATPSPAVSTSATPLASPLPHTAIVRYGTQTGSGTFGYFVGSSSAGGKVDAWTAMSNPSATPIASASAPAVFTTVQENYPGAIAQDGNTNTAIYFMSLGRYKQEAAITDQLNAYSSATAVGIHNAGGYADALGAINGVEPTISKVQAAVDSSAATVFPFSRKVYNVVRYPSAATAAYVGPDGFICKATDATVDRVKTIGYRTLINQAILSEGFAPMPVSNGSYCRVYNGNSTSSVRNTSAGTDITLASPSPTPTANAAGVATFKLNFKESVRIWNASYLQASQAGNANLAISATCTNGKSGTVPCFEATASPTASATPVSYTPTWATPTATPSASASSCAYNFAVPAVTTSPFPLNSNDFDSYNFRSINNMTVTISGIVNNGNNVSFALAKGGVVNRAGYISDAYTATIASSTVLPAVDPADAAAAAPTAYPTGYPAAPAVPSAQPRPLTCVKVVAPAPTITPSATASAVANSSGVATFNVDFSTGVRLTTSSKLTATQAGNDNLRITSSATSTNGDALALFDTLNTNVNDIMNLRLVSSAVVTVTGVAYGSPVSINFAAGAAKDLNGTLTPAMSFSVESNTTAPTPADTVAPTVTDNGSSYIKTTATGAGTFVVDFSEPVRSVDLTKFHIISNKVATAPVEITDAATALTSQTVYTCATVHDPNVWGTCSFWANNNSDNSNGSFAVTKMTVRVKSAVVTTQAALVIDAGAFSDKAGNANAAVVVKKPLATNNLTVVGTWATSGTDVVSSKLNDSRTYYVFGNSVNVVLAKHALGGKVSVIIDGVQYAVDPATITGSQISWDLTGSGDVTVALTGLANGYHTVAIKNLGQSPSALGTTAVKATFVKVTVKSVS